MKLSLLIKLLENKITAHDFSIVIEKEIQQYEKSLQKKGGSIIINLEEDSHLLFNKYHLINLCSLYLNDKVNEKEMAYISDSLVLSENIEFDPKKLIELIEEMTDAEINGKVDKLRIQQIVEAAENL